MLQLPKPEPRKRVKARQKRRAAKVVKSVRQQVAERDGFCRFGPLQSDALYLLIGSCEGGSEWAHLGECLRFKTRGMAPERRHTTAGSLMLCTRHHAAYDRGAGPSRIWIKPLSSAGADGRLCLRSNGSNYMECER